MRSLTRSLTRSLLLLLLLLFIVSTVSTASADDFTNFAGFYQTGSAHVKAIYRVQSDDDRAHDAVCDYEHWTDGLRWKTVVDCPRIITMTVSYDGERSYHYEGGSVFYSEPGDVIKGPDSAIFAPNPLYLPVAQYLKPGENWTLADVKAALAAKKVQNYVWIVKLSNVKEGFPRSMILASTAGTSITYHITDLEWGQAYSKEMFTMKMKMGVPELTAEEQLSHLHEKP